MIVVSETVQKFLLDYVRKRNLKPGDKLPSERELVDLLEVGRSSVREALQALSERGMIEKRAGKGAYLKSNIRQTDFMDLSVLLPSLDINTSLDLLEFRKGIEIEIAFLAAKRRSDECIQTLDKSIQELEEFIKAGKSIIVPDLEFHEALAKATQNEFIKSMYRSMVDCFKKIRIEMAINDDVEHALYYHKEILKAVKQNKPEESGNLMRRHIEDVQLNYQKMLMELGVSE